MSRTPPLPWPLLAALLLGAPLAARAQFVDASVPPLDDGLASDGISWGDFDGDGDHDLVIGNKTTNRLFRHDGSGFVDIATPAFQDSTTHARGVPFGDYDNDGDLDVYFCNKQVNRFFRNDAGVFVDATVPPLDDAASTRSAAWADYDCDGDLDLYLANEFAANRLFRNDAGTFVDVAVGPVADTRLTSSIVWGDVDDDGDPDLYLCNSGSASRLLRNEGDGTFADVTAGPLGDTGNGRGADFGDYDNDGDLDLYFSNGSTANKLLRNDGGSWTDVTAGPLGDAGQGTGVAWGDYDNDGDLDIYLVNWTTPNRLFRNDGGSFSNATAPPLGDPGPGKGTAWCDYDDDGDLDLYLANSGLANKMFRNDDSSGNRWLHLDLVGTVSNRCAIGARARVVAGGLAQIREVSGGYGVGSQGSLTLEFGLAAAASADSVIVRWPSGIVQVLTGVAADQRMTITEAAPTAAPGPAADAVKAGNLLLAADPNPFEGMTTIRYTLPRAAVVELRIFDVRGHLVRGLDAGARSAGPRTVVWDGRGDAGRPLPAGVYLYRLTAGAEAAVGKVVLLR